MADLTYSALADGAQLQWLMPDLPLVLWFGYGHCLTATRDPPGSAMRDFLAAATNMAGGLRVIGAQGWLEVGSRPCACPLL